MAVNIDGENMFWLENGITLRPSVHSQFYNIVAIARQLVA